MDQEYEKRLERILKRAEEVLGTPEHAQRWMNAHPRALGGKTPREFAETEAGAHEVECLLGRIEHGVFS